MCVAPGDKSARMNSYTFGPYRMVPSSRLLLAGEDQVELGGRAFDVLAMLVENQGEVLSRRQIIGRVWPDVVVDETNLRAQIAYLRQTLRREGPGDTYIRNVRGRGYVFTEPVRRGAAAPAKLPGRLHRIVGRRECLDLLESQLRAHRFVTLVGPGGIGKTAVAIELGHRVAADFDDAVCFVDLGSLGTPDQVVRAVAAALGCPLDGGDRTAALMHFLADRRMLMILDCCERVIEAVCELAPALLRSAPQLQLVATSREALRAEGEIVHWLEPLQLPVHKLDMTAAEALAAASVQLFMQGAAASGYVGELEDHDAGTAAAICRQLDGIPLAIELASSRVTTYGLAGLLQVLRGRSILSWPGRRLDPRHRTLEATLDWSFHMLPDCERRILARLSVFAGPFTMQAAQAIASNSLDDHWAVARSIERLADKSLLAIRSTGGNHSYRLLDMTRHYAGVKLAESGQRDLVARRHARFQKRYAAHTER
jgi:predicted ATPase/DNA-binding winged helix-turn-helix (wHTH) protein